VPHLQFFSADDLPPAWDELCADRDPYLKRSELQRLERAGLTRQSYHAVSRGERFVVAFTTVRKRDDLLRWAPWPWPFYSTMTYVCPPTSIDLPGIVSLDATAASQAIREIPGTKIVLNANAVAPLDGFVSGDYLPIVKLENRWSSFDDYVADLRSGYRRRLRRTEELGQAIDFAFLPDNALFDEQMYGLYLDVFDRADLTLEKLTLGYFQTSPSLILCLRVEGRVEAFIQMAEIGDLLRFEFGGFNRALNQRYDLYNNMLLALTRRGIDHGFRWIDYGQTAYDCKLRFGGRLIRNDMLYHDSNPVMQALTRRLAPHLDYPMPTFDFHVFKDSARPVGPSPRSAPEVTMSAARPLTVLLVRPRPHRQSLGLTDMITLEPLELEYVAAALKQDGHRVFVVDLILEPRPLAWFVRHTRPDIVMFTSYITHVNVIKDYADTVKRLSPRTVTAVGGVHSEVLPEDFRHRNLDVVIGRDGVEQARALARHVADTGGSAGFEPAVVPPQAGPARLPLPDRDSTARHRAHYHYAYHLPCALLKTSYGCPYNCRFCFCVEIAGHQYAQRPLDEVIAELEAIDEPNVFIVDDNFLAGRARLQQFCQLLDERGIRKRFIVFGRADFIVHNEDMIALLAAHGLDSIFVGLESFKQSDLDQFDKRMDVAVSEQASDILYRHHVDLCAGTIVGPDWDRADFEAFVAWLRRLHVRFINLQPLVPLPATPIYQDYADQLLLRREEYEKWDLTHLAILPTKLTPSRYYAEIIRAYLRTSGSLSSLVYVWRRCGTAVSWKCFKGALRVYWHYLLMIIEHRKVKPYVRFPGPTQESPARPADNLRQ